MKKDVMQKWVKALRSGKYKQTRLRLKDSTGYCCLGVLCDISAPETSEYWVKYGDEYTFSECNDSLPYNVIVWAGMKSAIGLSTPSASLTKKNDIKRWSFKKIADFIEHNYKKL